MIWLTLARGGAILSVLMRAGAMVSMVLALKELHDLVTTEIKPNRIYSLEQSARYLGMENRAVVRLVETNELRAKRVNGNYRIPGQSILDYLAK